LLVECHEVNIEHPFCSECVISSDTDKDENGNAFQVYQILLPVDISMADKGLHSAYILDDRTIRIELPAPGYGTHWGGDPSRKKLKMNLRFPKGTKFWYRHFCEFDSLNRAVLKAHVVGMVSNYALTRDRPPIIVALLFWQVAVAPMHTEEEMREFAKQMTDTSSLMRAIEGKQVLLLSSSLLLLLLLCLLLLLLMLLSECEYECEMRVSFVIKNLLLCCPLQRQTRREKVPTTGLSFLIWLKA
jgi:hypothetical protein